MSNDTEGMSFRLTRDQSKKYRRRSGRDWFPFYRVFTKLMTKMNALFIQDLINLGAQCHQVDHEGWFPCPVAALVDEWTAREQEYHLKALKEPVPDPGGGPDKPIVKTGRRGIPGRRWVCVDMDLIDRMVDAYLNEVCPPPDTTKTSDLHPEDAKVPGNPSYNENVVGEPDGNVVTLNAKTSSEKTEDRRAASPPPPSKPSQPKTPLHAGTVPGASPRPNPGATPPVPASRPAPLISKAVPEPAKGPISADLAPEAALAERVREWLKSKRRAPRERKDVWIPAARRMKKALADIGVTWDEVTATWEWYAANWDPDGSKLPSVSSVQDFHVHWNWISEARHKAEKAVPDRQVGHRTDHGDGLTADERRARDEMFRKEAADYAEIERIQATESLIEDILLPLRPDCLPKAVLLAACREGEPALDRYQYHADPGEHRGSDKLAVRDLGARFRPHDFHRYWWDGVFAAFRRNPALAARDDLLEFVAPRPAHPRFNRAVRLFLGLDEETLPDELMAKLAPGYDKPIPTYREFVR